MTLAQRYAYDKGVDTIVCLDGSEVLGAFLAVISPRMTVLPSTVIKTSMLSPPSTTPTAS